ncbi:MAG: hypothetical protein GF346_07945, partial [Candidatus Eisenbacteria bacterium]|nr:hypothetical protein [Candidatus Latescibacterota bacterium]MBD3302365.1 hypothetical protein [Candidatus Eisenbacteria bacterium]
MSFCKSRLIKIFLLLGLCLPASLIADEETEPFYGLWEYAPEGAPDDGLFLYRMVLRYRARAVPRDGGFLPEPFRAAEDSLGLISSRYEDFLYLQDSLALGLIPPATLPEPGRRYAEPQVLASIDSALIEPGMVYQGTPVHPIPEVPQEIYLERLTRRSFRKLWVEEAERTLLTIEEGGAREGVLPKLALPVEMPGAIRSIVGSGKPNLQVTGSERISFSGTSRWYPDRPVTEFQRQQSKFPQLDMKQELNLKLTGNIGDKVSVDVDQSSQASTPLANRIQIHYTGYEDEILQRVELGNTSLRLPGTQYVSYSGRHEGLFGINAQALVGDVEVVGILSKQEGKNETKSITKGAELRTIEIPDWRYRGGKFFFLTDPNGSPINELDVASVEVWVDDRDGANNNDQLTIPAIVTLEGDRDDLPPDSLQATGDFNQLVANEDYIVQTDVYTGYPVLILSDRQVLDGQMTKALAVRYDYQDVQGTPRQIGGFLGTQPDTLVLKLIRPAAEMGGTNPLDLREGVFSATRHLELRNIYDLGSNLSAEGLDVRIRYRGVYGGITTPDRIGENTFLEILGLDLFTTAGEGEEETPGPDGKIDERR